MELSINIEVDRDKPFQTQIFEQLRSLIITKRIKRGYRLPSSRELSAQLGVSRNTVKGAYEKLSDEGYLESRTGSGTFVSSVLPERSMLINYENKKSIDVAGPPQVELHFPTTRQDTHIYQYTTTELAYDFQLERTDPQSFPTRTWRRLINARLTVIGSNMARYGEPSGLRELRTAIAARLGAARGINVAPEQVMIVTGIQQGLNIVSHLFIRSGSKVVIEAPGYKGASDLFQNYGAELIPIPVDEDGIIIDKLPNKSVSIAFITPSRQFPMGATMPIENRKALVDWAAKVGSYIVEVDYDSDFRYESAPLLAVKAVDNYQSVIYLGSFSKTIGPGLRIGYMLLPADLIDTARSCKILLDYGLPWLDQAVLADFIARGSYETYLKRLRHLYQERRDSLINMLMERYDEVDLSGVDCGTHVIWKLPKDAPDVRELRKAMRKQQVGIYTLWHNAICNWEFESECNRLVLLGYGSISEHGIREGILRIVKELQRSS